MTFLKKLTIVAIVAVCAVCLALGIAGCAGGEEHVHTFSEDWTQTETEHWHKATCEHTTQKSGYGKHVDEDNNGKCDKCDYELRHTFSELWLPDGDNGHYHAATCHDGVKSTVEPHDYDENFKCKVCDYQHNHTFDLSHWEHDESTHWHAADCGHEVKQDETTHADADDDQFCDDCGEYVKHVHVFNETEWLYDINKHWHLSTCHPNDPTVKGNEAEHTFNEGVCVCGVKEIEKQAYGVLVDHEIVVDDFYTWRTGIQADGVTEVSVTEQGDVIYNRSGNIEGVYIADRKVKVEAEDTEGNGVPDAWFKVAMSENGVYHEFASGSNALAVAKSDENGIAELEFTPIGKYSDGSKVKYVILPAQALDIAALNGGDEEDYYPIPNRYSIEDITKEIVVNIQYDSDLTNAQGSFIFEFSQKWGTYHKFRLPYARYYADPLAATGLQISDSPYTFTTSGDDLFDYFYFVPGSRYSFDRYENNTTEEKATIEQNYREAASGIYQISFTVTGDGGTAVLYFWDEGGVELDAYYVAQDNGAPANNYITCLSGDSSAVSGISRDKFTGGNYVTVEVSPERGLRGYQLGLRTTNKVSVTITVERKDDYQGAESQTLSVSAFSNNYVLTENGAATPLKLVNVPAGRYKLTVGAKDQGTLKAAGVIWAYTDVYQRYMIWDNSSYTGLISIKASDTYLYILNNSTGKNFTVKLEKYTPPTIKVGTQGLPATHEDVDAIDLKVDDSVPTGNYIAKVTLKYGDITHYGLTVKKNGEIFYTLPVFESNYPETRDFTVQIELSAGDTLSFSNKNSRGISSFNVTLELTPVQEMIYNEEFKIEPEIRGQQYYYTFTAPETGTYKLTMSKITDDIFFASLRLPFNEDVKTSGMGIFKEPGNFLSEEIGIEYEFTLTRGQSVILQIYSVNKISAKLELEKAN